MNILFINIRRSSMLLGLVFLLAFAIYMAPPAISAAKSAPLQTTGAIPLPPSEHPRLYLRQHDLEELRRNIHHPSVKPIWEKTIAVQKYAGDNTNLEKKRLAFEAYALKYLVYNNPDLGRIAIGLALEYFDKVSFPLTKKDVTRDIGRAITGGAIVYDWCYPLLTPKEKKTLIRHFIRLAQTMEIGFPPVKQSALTGHAGEAQLFRDLLSMGIAVYDEDPTIYHQVAKRLFTEFIPARNFFYPSHLHHQGDSYGMYRYQWEMTAAWIYRRMGYPQIFSAHQGQLPYYWIYIRRPDGQMLRNGDCFNSNRAATYWAEPMAFLLPAAYYQDPYLADELSRQYTKISGDPIFELLFIDPDLPTKSVSELPLTRYFGYPMGTMVARTGWDTGIDSNTVVAEMKVGVFQFNNHQHVDSGHFQLYYRGGLAIDSGIYQGDYEYGSPHDVNYYKRTIAHNCLLVYDPNEQFRFGSRTGLVNDGGQRFPNNGIEPKKLEELLTRDYQVGSVMSHYFGPDRHKPDISYLKGDLTRAYTAKVQDYQRTFLFWNLKNDQHPAALIVLDRVTVADPSFKRTWLLHSIEEPETNGNITTIRRIDKGYHGQLITTTLLPKEDDLNISKIGGPGKEFTVNGINFPNHPNPRSTTDESGAWRIEITPKQPSPTTLFLNVLQVQDADIKEGLPVSMIENGDMIGVLIGNRLAFFNQTGKPSAQPFSFTIPKKEDGCQTVITDLNPGQWQLWKNGRLITSFRINPEQPVAIFTGETGTYEMIPAH
ncbi:MAG TPA: heparinase II/III family protein [Bacillota bacterium]|nr:heparinase II/III family protein [Bacillota bacterium]